MSDTKFNLEIVKGDLFTSNDDECLGHCVSRCLYMGKGIATTFKSKFGQVDELKAQNKSIGECAVLHQPEQNRYLYYCKFLFVVKFVVNNFRVL